MRSSFSWHSFSGVCVWICLTSIQCIRIKNSYFHNWHLIFPELNAFFFFFLSCKVHANREMNFARGHVCSIVSLVVLWGISQTLSLTSKYITSNFHVLKSLLQSFSHVSSLSDAGKPQVDIEWTISIASTSCYIVLRQIFLGQR